MSYTDPSPPPFIKPPYPGGDIGGLWPSFPMNTENPDSNSSFDNTNTNSYKRQRSCGGNNMQVQNNRPMQPSIPTNIATGTCHIFYKTRLCQKFFEGNCRNGDRCTFAHGHSDLRNPPPNWQEIVGTREKDKASGNWDDDQRIIQRMKICRKFYNGEECPYGNKCNFLHECPSKFKSDVVVTSNRETEDNSALVHMPANLNDSDQTENMQVKSTYWKTRLCGKWETTGFCPFGDKCHFAHGVLELHQPGQGGDDTTGGMMHNLSVDDVQPSLLLPPIISTTSSTTEEVRRSKWKVPRKINRIYGDWLDNVPSPPRGIPGRAGEES